MEIVIIITILLYVLSTAVYFAYLLFQKNYLHQTGFYLLAAGFLCHSAAISYVFIKSGVVPVNNLHETFATAGWAIAGVFIIFKYKYNLKILGVYAAPLATVVMLIASRLPVEPEHVKSVFNNIWLVFHAIMLLIGEASFAIACGVGIVYLVQEHAIKTKKHGFFFKRLPSLELLDTVGYASIVAGFTMLTIGLITGLVYAKTVWGRFWGWDPKEVWSVITWLLYAALLHERLAVGWRGRRTAIMAIVGFVVLLFTFFGVNILLQGHHTELIKF